MPKVSITTLGCKLNFAESATIVRQFTEKGFEFVPFGELSDVTIINTCTVTAQADRKSKFAVKKASKVSPLGKVVVIGCAAQLNPDKFSVLTEEITVVGTEDKFNIFNLLYNSETQKIHSCEIKLVESFDNAFSVNERTRSFLKIQDGCDYPCTYCAIPKARGKSRNPEINVIVNNAKLIAQKGIKEIVFTGVNIGDFGKSTNETFFDLIKELDQIEGIERYRISSIEPNLLTSEIIEYVAKSDKIMPHFHIPLQSGSDSVLKLMKRRYNTTFFKKKVLEVAEKVKDAFFGIDVIVGFPGETEELFKETYELLSSLPVSYLHVFPYSDRTGTIASEMKNKVNSEEITKRTEILEHLSNQKHREFYQKFIGETRKVLFESKNSKGKMFGFSDNYIKVGVEFNKDLINTIRKVKFLEFENDYIMGEIVE